MVPSVLDGRGPSTYSAGESNAHFCFWDESQLRLCQWFNEIITFGEQISGVVNAAIVPK